MSTNLPRTWRQAQSGLTIVELIVVLSILGTLILFVFTTLYDIYQSNVAALQTSTQTTNNRTALHAIEDDLSLATGYLSTVSSPTTPQGSNNDASSWGFKGSGATSRVLISQSYATTDASTSSSRALVYYSSGGCGNPDTSALAQNTYIYFVRNQTLYRRTIIPTSTCPPGPFQKSTCTAGQAATICQAGDAVLLENVTSFVPQYFANTTDATPIDVYNEPSDAVASAQIAASKAVTITLQTSQRINGIMNTYQSSIRVNKFNQ